MRKLIIFLLVGLFFSIGLADEFKPMRINILYTTWDTTRVNCYSLSDVPSNYTIDLSEWSMPTTNTLVTSHYGYRPQFKRMHKGVDVKVYIGDTIQSAWEGTVRVVKYEPKGYGNYIVVRHPNGFETIYGHLSKHLCKVGDKVTSGLPIGLGGNTGRSTGSHLHFETRIVGIDINPELIFDFKNLKVTSDYFYFTYR